MASPDASPSGEEWPKARSNRRALLIAAASVACLIAIGVVIFLATRRDDHDARVATDLQKAPAAPTSNSATPGVDASAVAATPPPPPPPTLPAWIEIRVARVEVQGSTEWDGPVHETSDKEICGGISDIAIILGPEASGFGHLLCSQISDQQVQKDPRDPDLQVLLEAPGVRYASFIVPDSRSTNFDYAFAIPGDALDADGVVVTVVDFDSADERGQEVGGVRLTKDELLKAFEGGTVVSRSTPNLATLEVAVREHDGKLREKSLDLSPSAGGQVLAGFDVAAGDIVRVEISGTWTIGTVHKDPLGPEGYAGTTLREYNLDTFPDFGHGAAVSLIGQQGSYAKVGGSPCTRFVNHHGGVVWLGINDKKPSDNRGAAHFRVLVRGAKAGEWKQPGGIFPCK